MKVEVYKCYLVEVVDENDNVVFFEYHFTDRKDALRIGKEEKERLINKYKKNKTNTKYRKNKTNTKM